MSKVFRTVVVSTLLVGAFACVRTPSQPESSPPSSSPLAIVHANVVDVEGGALLRNHTVLIRGNRIESVAPSGEARIVAGTRVIDASGKFVIPGLWDMYTGAVDARATGKAVLQLFVAHGVTGVKDVSTTAPLDELARLRNELSTGAVMGPRLVYSGRWLDTPLRRAPNNGAIIVRNAREVNAAVDSLARARVSFIKTGPYFSPDLFPAVTAAAKRHGLPVTSWVVSSWMHASNTGLTGIEHLADLTRNTSIHRERYHQFYLGSGAAHPSTVPRAKADFFFDTLKNTRDTAYFNETLRTLVRNRTWVTTNHGTWGSLAYDGDDPARNRFRTRQQNDTLAAVANRGRVSLWATWRDDILAVFGALCRAQVSLIAGSGFDDMEGGTPGLTLHDALYWLARGGCRPLELLRSATINPARFMNATDSVGTVRPGKLADLVLLDANPLEDIANARLIHGVVLKGVYLDRKALDAFLEQAVVH